MTVATMLDKTAATADTFRLLSACYYQPDKNMLFDEDLFGQLRKALDLCQPEHADLADAMATALEPVPDQDLLVDYAKLFVGPDALLAPPFGSVYLDKEKTLMGDSTMDVIARYNESEFDLSAEVLTAPDHIAVELEFLYLLCYNESLALAEQHDGDQARWYQRRQDFIEKHIGRWIERFCNNVREKTQFDYYRHLADLTQQFIILQKTTV